MDRKAQSEDAGRDRNSGLASACRHPRKRQRAAASAARTPEACPDAEVDLKFSAPARPKRVLLIVAPTLLECFHAAKEYGLTPPHIDNFRKLTKACCQLRGVRAGTPFIAINRRSWAATPHSFELDQALDLCLRTGRVRIAQPDDLKRACPMPTCRKGRREVNGVRRYVRRLTGLLPHGLTGGPCR